MAAVQSKCISRPRTTSPAWVRAVVLVAVLRTVAAHAAPFEAARAVALSGAASVLASDRAVADAVADRVAGAWSPADWRPDQDGLRSIGRWVMAGVPHVRLQQTWRGLPVVGGELNVELDGRGGALVLGRLCPAVAPPAPVDGEARARAAAMDAAQVSGPGWTATTEPWVERAGAGDRIVWRTVIEGPRPWDARTVWRPDGASIPSRIEGPGASASCLVYPDDGDDPLAERTLERLDGDGSALRGQWVVARDLARGDWSVPGGDFRVSPSAPDTSRFDEANVYWYADQYVEHFLRPLGFAGFDPPLTVRVHEPIWPPYTAITVGSYVMLAPEAEYYFRDPAKARDLVCHEIQHAVTYAAGVQASGPTRHPAALHEGLSDYFAAAWTADPAVGEWVYFRFPNGATRVDMPASDFQFSRWDTVSFGPNLPRSPWANGMILSGALWDLRARIGRSADSLALEALAWCPTEPLWSDYANGLVLADARHHGARHRDAIGAALGARGIRGRTPLSIVGPSSAASNVSARFVAPPLAVALSASMRWLVRRECRTGPCPGGWVEVGTRDTLELAVDTDYTLRLEVVDVWGDTVSTERLVNVLAPQVTIVGPLEVPKGSVNRWRAVVVGLGGENINWARWLRRYGAPRQPLGAGEEVSVPAETSFVLEVTVQDRLFRSVTRHIEVTAKNVAVPPGPLNLPTALALECRLPPGTREAELRWAVPRDGDADIDVWDVSGRRRAVVRRGFAVAGHHVQRWDTGALEPGVYLARLRTADGARQRKFAVIR